jgi:hypothetical protein
MWQAADLCSMDSLTFTLHNARILIEMPFGVDEFASFDVAVVEFVHGNPDGTGAFFIRKHKFARLDIGPLNDGDSMFEAIFD